MSTSNAVFPGQITAKFSVLSHKESCLVITAHLFKTSPIKEWLDALNDNLNASVSVLDSIIVTPVLSASQLTVHIKGAILDAEKFVWYVAGRSFFVPAFDYEQVKHTELTPHGAAAVYKAIARCCTSYSVLPEEVMQDPSMSGDLLRFVKDEGFGEEQAKAILATAGYYFVQ